MDKEKLCSPGATKIFVPQATINRTRDLPNTRSDILTTKPPWQFFLKFFKFFLIFFFKTRTSEQRTAIVDLVNFYYLLKVSSEHTDFVTEFEQDSVGTYFIANDYSTNHVPTRVRNAKTPTNT